MRASIHAIAELVHRQTFVLQILMKRVIETEALTEGMLKMLIETRCVTGPEQHALSDRLQSFVAETKRKIDLAVQTELAAWAERNPHPPG